jgi:hypothetical protein
VSFFLVELPIRTLARQLRMCGAMTDNGIYEQTARDEQTMTTTILNYPGFQALPKGVKQMLLASESYFFDHGTPRCAAQKYLAQAVRTTRRLTNFQTNPLLAPRLSLSGLVCSREEREPRRHDGRGRIMIGGLCEAI